MIVLLLLIGQVNDKIKIQKKQTKKIQIRMDVEPYKGLERR